MDKNILNNLGEFLPKEVIDEIALVNGLEEIGVNQKNKKINNEENKGNYINNNEEGNNNKIDNQENNKNKDNNDDNKKDRDNKKINNKKDKNNINKSDKKNNEEINNNNEEINNNNDKKEKIIKNNFNSLTDFLNKFQELNFKTKIEIRGDKTYYGFNKLDDLDLFYFVSPLSINKIEDLIYFFKEIQNVFKGNNKNKFIPFETDGIEGELIGEEKLVKQLFNLVYIYIFGIGKEIILEEKEYNNFKFGKIDKDFLSNPDFYKNFLIKEKINIKTHKISLNTPKNAYLKYYLKKLGKNLFDSKSKKLIKYLTEVLLKDVDEKKYNINISNHKSLQKIFKLIKEIIESNIRLINYLVENATEVYEYWLLKELLLYGNLGEEYQKNEKYNKNKNIDKLKELTESKIKEENNKLFIEKEDKKENFGKTATFGLGEFSKNILDNYGYKITLSFGGNILNFDSGKKGKYGDNLLEENFCNILKNRSTLDGKILKHKIKDDNNGLTPDYVIKIHKNKKLIGNIIIDAKFSKFGYIYNGKIDYNPWLGYFEELKRYFSYKERKSNESNLPTKVIILYPGNQEYGSSNFGEYINNYFERTNNIIALPLSLGENKYKNLKSIFKFIKEYILEFK